MKRRSLTRVFAGALGLLLLAAGWLFFGPTQLGGSTSYAVIVGTSMEPMLHRGDLAVIREESTYRIGDVVLYEAPELGSNVLHRIVRVQNGRFVLKGDNNDFLDSEQPTEAQIVGKLWLSAPQVGRVTDWLHTPSHAALLVGLATLLALGGGAGVGAASAARGAGAPPKRLVPSARARPASVVAGDPLPLLGALGVASVLFAVLAILSFTRPVTVTEPVAEAYVHQGRFEYSASVRRNAGVPRRARDDRRADLPPTRAQAPGLVRIPARGATARRGERSHPARCTRERRPRLGAPLAARTGAELPRRAGFRQRHARSSCDPGTRRRHPPVDRLGPDRVHGDACCRGSRSPDKAGRDPIDATFAPALRVRPRRPPAAAQSPGVGAGRRPVRAARGGRRHARRRRSGSSSALCRSRCARRGDSR